MRFSLNFIAAVLLAVWVVGCGSGPTELSAEPPNVEDTAEATVAATIAAIPPTLTVEAARVTAIQPTNSPSTPKAVPGQAHAPIPTAIPSPSVASANPGQWRGLTIAAENRCSPYAPDDYPYPQSVEARIIEDIGGVYGPYTMTWFVSARETDIEHIVARSEAHDSGLCGADSAKKKQFSRDLLNLTLASPSLNRNKKSGKDAAEWLPDQNRCWFASRVVQVRQRYGLTIDLEEKVVLESLLTICTSTDMVIGGNQAQARPTSTPQPGQGNPLARYDDNGNGRITCAEARNHGIAPVRRGHPAYQYMNDRDNDGMVCE